MGNYQKFKGDPENKLFYLLDGLVGGINTEFSDDASSDTDFDSIVNFDVDKLGTLTKRNGFGKIKGLASLLQRVDLEGYNPQTDLPWITNITEDDKNVEEHNDNLVYVKLLKNDNNCFRNLAAFDYYRDYQRQYGFQNNEFKLLIITTKVQNGVCVSSKAWHYCCKFPMLAYDEGGNELPEDTILFEHYSCDLPVIFKWDKTLMNMDSIEYFSNIWFTNNDKALVRFDRNAEIKSNEDLDSAFHYVGVVEGKENEAYKPSTIETKTAALGINSLTTNPLYDIKRDDTVAHSIQGAYITTENLVPLDKTLVVGEPIYLAVLYTGSNEFSISAKNGDTDLGVNFELVNDLSVEGSINFYKLTFGTVPDGEVEITIQKTGSGADVTDPYRFFANTGQISPDLKPIETLNVGNCGICMMSDNRVAYYREDVIFFSDINYLDYVPYNNYLKLPIEPTDKITKISYFKGVYIVFTKERIYKLIGNFGSSNFACEPVNTSLGCHAGHTVVPIEDTLYFASPRGLYALKSNTFIEGMQNLVELDIKVKKLTSDFTLYEDELKKPAMRFNGINEKAYAFRYRDKYMLFFNSSYEKGDYAAKNNLDVLVYDYSMKSYTTYSFIEKPTFLFMVDNSLQTLCATTENEDKIIEESVFIDYDLENQTDETKIVDNSGNGYDGVIAGDLVVNQESYVLGSSDYIEVEVPTNVDTSNFLNNLNASLDIKLGSNQENKTILEAVGKAIPDEIPPYTGRYTSQVVNGYEVVLDYIVNYNDAGVGGFLKTYNTSIQFVLSLNRTSTDIMPKVSGIINMKDVFNDIESMFEWDKPSDDGITSIRTAFSNVAFNTSFEDALSVELLSDTLYLNIKDGILETQNRDIKINLDLVSYEPYSYYEKGSKVSGEDYRKINELSWIRFGVPYSVVAYDGYARMTVTKPYIYHNGAIGVASRAFNVSAAGKTMSFTMPKLSTSTTKGTVYATGTTTKYIDIPYSESILKGDGKYTVTVKASWAFDGTLSSKHYDTLNSSFSLTLPTIKLKEGYNTSEQLFEGTSTYELKYNPVEDDIIIKLKLNDENAPVGLENKGNTLYFEVSDTQSEFGVYCKPVDVSLRHIYKLTTKGNLVEVYCDNAIIGEVTLPDNYLDRRYWKTFIFGTDSEKKNYLNWEMFNLDLDLFKYSSEGNYDVDLSDIVLYDNSMNNVSGSAHITSKESYKGITFNKSGQYIELPKMAIPLTYGFDIDLDFVLSSVAGSFKIFDFATAYGNANVDNKYSSINLSVDDGLLTFNSTKKDLKGIKLKYKELLKENERYSIKIKCEKVNDEKYSLSLYVNSNDPVDILKIKFDPTEDIERKSNFIGKSNNQNDGMFTGTLYSFELKLAAHAVDYYLPPTIYEFDTAYSDFDKPIKYELETKGINLKYPQHIKKLKHIFVKARGGYQPNDLIFELYTDGYLENDPKSYYCYVDDTGQIVYNYEKESNLTIEERASVFDNISLGKTRLGEGNYQTVKLVIPSKGKNFKIKMYGENKDYISLESFGFVSKLGKVKQN